MNVLIFRRDLRSQDNTALNWLNENATGEAVLPVFIFDPVQIDRSKNSFFSDSCVEFMHESLQSLTKTIPLQFYTGRPVSVLTSIQTSMPTLHRVIVNADYTPFSQQRDRKIEQWCNKHRIDFVSLDDMPLGNFHRIRTLANKPYKRFRYFCQKTLEQDIPKPRTAKSTVTFVQDTSSKTRNCRVSLKWLKTKYQPNEKLIVRGGRKNGLQRLKKALPLLSEYSTNRMKPWVDGQPPTTLLSAYLKFGVLSAREVFQAFLTTVPRNHPIIRQLVWKDFYYNLIYYFPQTFTDLSVSYLNKFPWKKSTSAMDAWCSGKTGFPFVDAGMRQLVQTGYMPNRLRMVCACFLVKILHINWKWGEKFFAQHLLDYDPAINNGNWQWVASTGTESQAYYRYLNPVTDIPKFDPDCEYIKHYVPELRKATVSEIYNWHQVQPERLLKNKKKYVKPIVKDFQDAFMEYKKIVVSLKRT